MRQVDLETSAGTIRVELDDEKAPETVKNFLTNVENGHYVGHNRDNRVGDSSEDVVCNLETSVGLEQAERKRPVGSLKGGLGNIWSIEQLLAHDVAPAAWARRRGGSSASWRKPSSRVMVWSMVSNR